MYTLYLCVFQPHTVNAPVILVFTKDNVEAAHLPHQCSLMLSKQYSFHFKEEKTDKEHEVLPCSH